MERIPYDFIINDIIPYTYNIQPDFLLEDIKNYYTIKSKIMDDKYETYYVKLELLVFLYGRSIKFNNILHRHFMCNLKNYDYDNIKNFSIDKKFNILFGLFTKEERIQGLDYVFNSLDGFILK